jgi:hypothetical protein
VTTTIGHAPEALEDSESVDFSPTQQFQRVLDHLTGAAAPSATASRDWSDQPA